MSKTDTIPPPAGKAQNPRISFNQWLTQFTGADSPAGDLAYDVACDPGFPSTGGKATYRRYLESVNACNSCLEALDHTWEAYRRSVAWAA